MINRRKFRRVFGKKTVVIVVLMITTAAMSASIFFFFQYQKAQSIIDKSGITNQIEAEDLAKKISGFISLPEGEIPSVATVSDYKKLAGQSFFEKSRNGDKVLIYTKAKKAYLYRPSTNKLIDVTIVNIDSGVTQQKPVSADINTAETKIVLKNGTTFSGLTHRLEPEIKKVLPNAVIVRKENAGKNDYQTTSVIVLSEYAKEAASLIADYFNAKVTVLPQGENRPNDADVLVIVGANNAPASTQSKP